ncbi:helix-turn-helix domain-containing protein [Methylobacterium indicum]|uniref:XRE family transcriptional regulator n=1 Tax=Methylobacterium indicum TaxID=1775910 RepID=A0A0J6RIH8_9HYPH|nr:XRE family transcriptional regulator [Methylobacterium indicum]KMO20892.1 XRE family transcriptional regulator [Methylobacterium indicum]KMO21109.1 XRE family transcriptional regulator [Methylobacterium indicum]BCM86743.1 XRE family transcriptional regulator [Methylobacterium indicum]
MLNTGSNAPAEDTKSLERALGHQIRVLRRERELSVADLGAAAGISSGMVSKIENGQIAPSLATINAVAQALNVPITTLFAAFEESRDCSYVRKGTGVVIERRGTKVGHIYELLGAGIRGNTVLEPYLITLEHDAEVYTGFRHAGIEFIYMLTGEVIYRHAGHDYHLKPGDSLLFDAEALHGPQTLVERPMTYLSIIAYPRP